MEKNPEEKDTKTTSEPSEKESKEKTEESQSPPQQEQQEDVQIPSDQLLQYRKDTSLRHRGEIKSEYKFWSEQPVPQFNKDIGVSFGPITKDNKVEEERQEPYSLPEGFEWLDVDVTKENELNRLYEFLKNNYVEDDDHMFRFDYCQEFLKWHLTAPGYHKEWLISVVREDKKKNKKKNGWFY